MITADMMEYKIPKVAGDMIQWWGEPMGTVEMAVYATSTSIQKNLNWSTATYVGLTQDLTYYHYEDPDLGETYTYSLEKGSLLHGYVPVDGKEDTHLEVLSITTRGRYYQVFLKETAKTNV